MLVIYTACVLLHHLKVLIVYTQPELLRKRLKISVEGEREEFFI